jgi:Zn-dependent protease
LISDVRIILLIYFTILIALTVHEFAHAFTADRLGDDTPRRAGRLSLNPFMIIKEQPIGALVVPLLAATQGAMIGWASTPVNFSRVRRGLSVRKAAFLITAAGPASNIMLAVVGAVASVGLLRMGFGTNNMEDWQSALLMLFTMMVQSNIFLALFNLLPISPLDGYTVATSALPARFDGVARFLEQYSMVLFILVIIFAGRVLSPLAFDLARGLRSGVAAVMGGV